MFDYDSEVVLTNFHEGDKSLWTKTVGKCLMLGCGGAIWILTQRYREEGLLAADMLGACEKCHVSGDCQGLLHFGIDVMIEPPAESCP